MGYPAHTVEGSSTQNQLVTGQGLLVSLHSNANTLFAYDGTSSSTGTFLGYARFVGNVADDDNVFTLTHPVQFKVGLYVAQNSSSPFTAGVI